VDEFTGRLQPGRRWSRLASAHRGQGKREHPAESRTYASITYQNFFRMYPKLSGMTGTAATFRRGIFQGLRLRGIQRAYQQASYPPRQNDQIFRTEAGKFRDALRISAGSVKKLVLLRSKRCAIKRPLTSFRDTLFTVRIDALRCRPGAEDWSFSCRADSCLVVRHRLYSL